MLRFYEFVLTMMLAFSVTSFSNAGEIHPETTRYSDIGNGLTLEIIPAEFATFVEGYNSPRDIEWVLIPATYETIIETVIVKPAHKVLDLTPPLYDEAGVLKTPARAKVTEIAAVTREKRRRVVKTPARAVKRIIPVLDGHSIVRKQIKPETYIIRNKDGLIIRGFDDPVELANFLNAR